MKQDVEVLVVGAGPVGLTMAIALRRLDMRVRVVDRAPGTNREPRADVIFPRAGEALGALGVGETIRRHAYEMESGTVFSSGRRVGTFITGRLSSRYPTAMTIEQHQIERLLTEELARLGVTVDWRTRVTDLAQDDAGVHVTVEHPHQRVEHIEAAWVVGCDGVRSTVRRRLGIAFPGAERRNMQVVQGNVVPSWSLTDKPGNGYFFLAPYRSVIAFPTPGCGYRIFCVRDNPEPRQDDAPTLRELRDLVAEAARMPELDLVLTEPVWLSRARFADRIATRLRSGRVLLAGDAAHTWAPLGGHGMNVGMLGAYNLGWKLAAVHRGQAADPLLDTYDAEQRVLAEGVIRDMRTSPMEMVLPPGANGLRGLLVGAMLRSSSMQRRTEWMMSDFGRHHRHSPLSWHRSRWPTGGPRAGDRLPDVPVVTADGHPSRLHDLLGYNRWTLLHHMRYADTAAENALRLVQAACPAPMTFVPIAAAGREAARSLGDPANFLLVRPDGHIGLVCPVNRPAGLRDYMRRHLVGDPRPVPDAPAVAGRAAG
ncbi:FAD-dependent monooxygenase [Actinoplanes teichomyceticus]|uniref:2-polyprenyl-6-methoxyphenol hydroxylase-like FAD-dependent oxidoreductase n=1 Tax=Actinoplanes teichomyceticus TaxID=1867 RepID=A0A561WJ38_ACTTI|nr:FAD-dependent monooxygenase [Actinoplanes teichomyceticus]TWG23830.1 2-polyprenyl-6-methoxyphenol hydroxylase-like FAD-dependent oxidoreductase [Actinoplanes teichomyceticus]GIF11874.1 oxygenase [Actinoplanes teichomyceticus]